MTVSAKIPFTLVLTIIHSFSANVNEIIPVIDTAQGAQASVMIYTEIPNHMDDMNLFFDGLLPWSKQLPGICKKNKRRESN